MCRTTQWCQSAEILSDKAVLKATEQKHQDKSIALRVQCGTDFHEVYWRESQV